jgi:hypothetical protein
MPIWSPMLSTLFSIVLWLMVFCQPDEHMRALIIAGSLGAPVFMPIIAIAMWFMYFAQ